MLRTISRFHVQLSLSLKSLPYATLTNNISRYEPHSSLISSSNPILESPKFCSYFSTLSFPFSSSQILQRRHEDGDSNVNDEVIGRPPKLFVVQPRFRPEPILRWKLEEALNLANSLDEQRDGYYDTEFSEKELPPHVVVQNPIDRSPRADTYFRKGTVDTVKCHLYALESKDEVDAIFVNASLSGVQQRNLERIWGKPVLDRVGLIIEIFNAHAQTKEAKLQAELAALMYKKSRLVRVRGPGGRYTFGAAGEAEVVSARGRGSGGRGFISGSGETELQLQRRRIWERQNQLLSEIKDVQRTRAVQRASRKRHGGSNDDVIATVAVVGYTNAGKSTLVSELSDSYLYCDDRLFATVDPKLRSVILPSGRKVLLSDTVGFVSDLPVQLVKAFHATLEEVVEADLLVHVLDSSSPILDEQRETVFQVLRQIGVSEEKLESMIEVWNKIDLQDKEFECDQYGKDEKIDDLSDAEDGNASDRLLRSEVSEADDNEDAKSEWAGNPDEDLDDQQGDYSDSWLLSEQEQESLVDYEGSSVGQDTLDNSQSFTYQRWRNIRKDPQSESETTAHVKISALMGVGLQELLKLIDERLKIQNERVMGRTIFDCKWRPPRSEDTIAAEQ